MVQSVGAKILHVVIWLVVSWILLKLLCQVLRKITALKMSPQASRLTVKIVKEAGYIDVYKRQVKRRSITVVFSNCSFLIFSGA